MIIPDVFLRDYSREIGQFLFNSESVVIILLDNELNIIEHNECFGKRITLARDSRGKNITSFLLPESHGLLPSKNLTKDFSVGLNFIVPDASTLSLHCHIFATKNEHYLIVGDNFMQTNDEILQQMTVLSNEMANMSRDLQRKNRALKEAQAKIKILGGIIPICMHCKKIRDDEGYWNQLEKFITEHSEAQFSHGICDECMEKHYPEIAKKRAKSVTGPE